METSANGSAETFHSDLAGPPPDTIEQAAWQLVSPRYRIALRLYVASYAAVLLLAPWIAYVVLPYFPEVLPWSENILVLGVSLILLLVWAPRRALYTQYLLRERDINLQTGCWWRRSTSVAINRIQHLAVSQPPIERALGLGKLEVYTAGGIKSDMVIPGLELAVAQRLKTRLLEQVGAEEGEDERP